MHLSHLALHEFRNFKRLDLSLGRGISLFYGENAQGKTNLLEAVSMLATSNSFHATSDREVVNWYTPERVARILAEVERREDDVKVEIVIVDGSPVDTSMATSFLAASADRQRKRIKVNGVVKKAVDLMGQVTVVLFAPTDLRLVDGSPEDRRRFLDRSLCQVQPRYCAALARYRKVITQRSALLKRIRENQEDPRMLDFLDEKLVELANLIIYERRRMVDALNTHVDSFQAAISGGREGLQIAYRPAFQVEPTWNTMEALEAYRQQLSAARRKEIQQGVCLLGPHRDDLDFVANDVNLLTYGSRGQQRTAALSAKLAELAFMRAATGEEPILLLDDVFSELDAARREYLLRQVLEHEQALITTTDFTGIPDEILAQAHRYSVIAGEVTHTHF
ncbi:MAG TPA: DNA replication/repair protein RecF [Ktedonobacteraceae bacterium]|nr:DNA replication/repair protein RecF [Ktedonobacteraceae bacterium]